MSHLQYMNKKYLEQIPQWYSDNDDYHVVMTNDIDGLLSASILREVKGWKTECFYDLTNCYSIEEKRGNSSTRVWVDTSLTGNQKAFDNHVGRTDDKDIKNELAINPNLIANVTSQNYYEKYAGSTALLIWSIYDLPLPQSEVGKMLLLAIDAAFTSYYSDKFRERNLFYISEMLEFPELVEVEKRHTKQEFYNLITDNHLTNKTEVVDNKLRTTLDLDMLSRELGLPIELPEEDFYLRTTLKNGSKEFFEERVKDMDEKPISVAFILRYKILYSYLEKEKVA